MRQYSQKERAWLWLNDAIGSNTRAAEQLRYLNDGLLSLRESIKAGRPVKLPDSITAAQRDRLIKLASENATDDLIAEMEKKGIYAATLDSADYPPLLREIYDPPTVLYVKGRLDPGMKLPIAVVGSRKCSDYGREVAAYFGKQLVKHGACVISGLASGCDSEAAKGALSVRESEMPTVAVLGCGVDVIYPHSSAELYEAIVKRGAVVSEFKPGKAPTAKSFPQRNRIISGLSKGVLVVEAGARSGTRITTDFAHEQGRDVFAVPGRINDLLSVGTNGLIKSGGAKAVFDVDDILYEYGMFIVKDESIVKAPDLTKLPAPQRAICGVLLLGEKTIDELCDRTGLSVSDLNTHLTEMELLGIIKQLPNGEYALG